MEYKKSIGKYEPIKTEGLMLYPILVADYYEFMAARQAIEFMQQSMPPELLGIPLLDAYYQYDLTRLAKGETATGLFMSALLALALALRLPGKTMEDKVNNFEIRLNQNDRLRIKELTYSTKKVSDGQEQQKQQDDDNLIIHSITPIQFARLRPIIAAQNGVELYSDSTNPELIQAERDLADRKAPNMKIDVDSMVTAAAIVTGIDEQEIYSWPILKLNRRLETVKRMMDYIVCGIGETQGTSWKGGNPYPHPWFERLKDDSDALIPLQSFAGGMGMDAVRNAESVSTM